VLGGTLGLAQDFRGPHGQAAPHGGDDRWPASRPCAEASGSRSELCAAAARGVIAAGSGAHLRHAHAGDRAAAAGALSMRPSSVLLVGVVKLLVGAYARWVGTQPTPAQRIYFANHTSHIDTLALWSALPRACAPHAAHRGARLLGQRPEALHRDARRFGAVLIDRARENATVDPLEPLRARCAPAIR
jgi:hypothetical protein